MSIEKILVNEKNETFSENGKNLQKSSAIYNHLETLETFARLFVQEVEALRNDPKLNEKKFDKINNGQIDLCKEVQDYEAELIRRALTKTKGRQRSAAKLLNVKISTLNTKIKRYGISISGLEFMLK